VIFIFFKLQNGISVTPDMEKVHNNFDFSIPVYLPGSPCRINRQANRQTTKPR